MQENGMDTKTANAINGVLPEEELGAVVKEVGISKVGELTVINESRSIFKKVRLTLEKPLLGQLAKGQRKLLKDIFRLSEK